MKNELIYAATDRRDGRIETNQLADGAVTKAKLADDAAEALLPTVTSEDSGKVLSVNSSGEWEAEALLPTVTSEDSGKVLSVNSSGEWEAAENEGGGNENVVLFYWEYDEEEYDYVFKCNWTYADLSAAFRNCENLTGYYCPDVGVLKKQYRIPLTSLEYESNYDYVECRASEIIKKDGTKLTLKAFVITYTSSSLSLRTTSVDISGATTS